MTLQLALDFLTGLLLVSGAAFVVVGGIGLIRLPDFFCRAHGAGVTDTLGASLVLIGLAVQSGFALETVKLAIILFFLLVTSPTSCHALSKAALTEGLVPEVIDKPTPDDETGETGETGADGEAGATEVPPSTT